MHLCIAPYIVNLFYLSQPGNMQHFYWLRQRAITSIMRRCDWLKNLGELFMRRSISIKNLWENFMLCSKRIPLVLLCLPSILSSLRNCRDLYSLNHYQKNCGGFVMVVVSAVTFLQFVLERIYLYTYSQTHTHVYTYVALLGFLKIL